jgi:very-short-patch-repair endonuclease
VSTLRPLRQGLVRIDEFQELLAAGSSRRAIEASLRAGRRVRARRDVYVRQPAPEPLMQALRIGGRLACASAAEHLGLWVPRDGRLHVHVWDGSTRLRDRDDRHARLERREGLVLHWSDLDAEDGTRCATSLGAAVRCIAECFGVLDAIRVADSALQRRRATREELRRALDGFEWLEAPAIEAVSAGCGSGFETDAKLLLMAAGLAFEQQVPIPRVGVVDFVVCGCVIVEVDGRETHEASFEEDRRRDAEALLLGYVPVRVSARWLAANPERFIALVRAALAVHPRG